MLEIKVYVNKRQVFLNNTNEIKLIDLMGSLSCVKTKLPTFFAIKFIDNSRLICF